MQVQLARNYLAQANTSNTYLRKDGTLFIFKINSIFFCNKFFLLLTGSSWSKGFYAGFWIMNEVMNCSCCLLFCQSAVWRESRLTLCASDHWKAARGWQIEPGIEYAEGAGRRWDGGAEARFLRSPLNGAGCAHADADVRMRRWPWFTRHPPSRDREGRPRRDDAAEREG